MHTDIMDKNNFKKLHAAGFKRCWSGLTGSGFQGQEEAACMHPAYGAIYRYVHTNAVKFASAATPSS